jgi:uncharacterized membrane protein YeiH
MAMIGSDMIELLHAIDILGTFVFALSGAIVGVKRNFDIFGVFVLALITATGGGIIRDLCISATPPAGLISKDYLIAVIIAVLCVSFFQKIILSFEKPSLFFDAIGLGFFASFGANKTYLHTGDIQLSILLGCVSAVGGGCIRDILSGKTPTIFTTEIYASAALVGASIELLGSTGTIPQVISIWLSIFVCTLIRMLSLKYNIKLPSIKNTSL